jgi:uncharacterized Zn finger protein (UPF0148 family)
MVGMVCGKCGIPFAVPAYFRTERQSTGANFFCPNGHCRVYRETTEERLQREKEALQRDLATEEANKDWWRTRQEKTERSLTATRGVVTRTKKRIAKGMCPCCQRHFVNLAGHMKDQHPRYAEEA